MIKIIKYIYSFTIPLLLIGMIGITEATAQTDNTSNENKTIQLHKVQAKYVCMITNKLFEEKQIPVPIDGKTYYGCCQNCVKKLNENPESRFAIDPVSGEKVNKATAVLGAGPKGKIYYFESVANMKRFEPESEPEEASDGK